jgi:hypothetical protein
MDEITAANVLRWYESLEEQVMDFLQVVALRRHNLHVWSPKLATVVVEACSLIDSVLRDISPARVTVRGTSKKRSGLTLPDYAELYCTPLRLPARTAILLTDTPEYRTPFGTWSKGPPFDSPPWWQVYNRFKHRRLAHFTAATLNTAIDALSGALVIIATVPALLPAVFKHGWLNLEGYNPELALRDLQSGLFQDKPVFLETSLFGVPLGKEPLPANIKDFRPMFYGASYRLLRWFGKL